MKRSHQVLSRAFSPPCVCFFPSGVAWSDQRPTGGPNLSVEGRKAVYRHGFSGPDFRIPYRRECIRENQLSLARIERTDFSFFSPSHDTCRWWFGALRQPLFGSFADQDVSFSNDLPRSLILSGKRPNAVFQPVKWLCRMATQE